MKEVSMEFLKNRYLSKTIIFATPEKTDKWTLNGFKLAYLIACHMSEERIFIEKKSQINSLDDETILKHIETVKRKFTVSKDEFMNLTGVGKSHVAKAIKDSCSDLMRKNVTLSNPLDPENPKSFKMIHWFSEAEYDEKTGVINIEIEKKMIPYMVVLVNYTKLDYRYVTQLKNIYSARIYLMCKITQSRYQSYLCTKISLLDFKKQIGVDDKYQDTVMFKKRIIDIAVDEINNITDISLDYELHKTGKRFTDITLKFSQKKDTSKQLDQPKRQSQEIEHQAADAPLNLDINDQDIIIAAQLQSYGIPRKKALEYVKTYGSDTCKIGIEKLLGEIQKGRDIKNISGYLVSCIENAGNNSSSQEIKAAMDAADELVQDRKAHEMERFNSFDTYINNNEQQITVLLARHEANEKLTDELEIDMLRCLKDVIAQYEDLESMSPYYLTLRFKGDILNYAKIKSLVEELEVATKEERITKLKADLEAKKLELENVSEKAKELVEKEITMLKVAIADLV